jgi:hypothetical protein
VANVKPADAGSCLETYHIERGRAPLGEAPARIAAATIDPARQTPVAGHDLDGRPALWLSPDKTQLVVDDRLFTDLAIADSTRLAAGQSAVVGKARAKLPGRALLRFLLEAEIIRTYWHVEATVCLERERDAGGGYEADLGGVHVYFTNQRNERRFAFTLRVSPDGEIAISGRDGARPDR